MHIAGCPSSPDSTFCPVDMHSNKGPKRPSFVSIPASVQMQPEAIMQLACKLSLDNGSFIDTKFIAFSRRNASGVVYAPKAVFANSWMLRAKVPQYFENCRLIRLRRLIYTKYLLPVLYGGYDGSCTTGALNGLLSEDLQSLNAEDSLGYDSDSDIEDDDDDDHTPPTSILKDLKAKLDDSSVAKNEDVKDVSLMLFRLRTQALWKLL